MSTAIRKITTISLVFLFMLSVGAFASAQDRDIRESRRIDQSELRDFRALVRGKSERYRSDEIIVKVKGEERFKRVRIDKNTTVEEALRKYQGDDTVLYAEPNYIAYAFSVPNDPFYSYQWHFDNNVYGGIGYEEANDTSDGSGVIVAVIDTGVAYEDYRQSRRNRYYLAPDLAETTFVPGYDFVNNDTHPNDDEGHGTHVTGTIAQSTGNGTGVAGLAPGASIMPIKVLNSRGSGTYADVAEGIRWAADNGAHVINLSLGGSVGASYLEEALAYAYSNGVTIVAASGNGGTGSVSYPAAYDAYVIAVGATRFDEAKTGYSNYGPSLDIVAPGGDTSVDQNGDGYGDGVLQQTFGSRRYDFGYYFYQGTSMATPHVAGVAALVISNGNATTPADVRSALLDSADDLGAPGRDDVFGNGLLNAPAALAWTSGGTSPPPPPPPPPAISVTPSSQDFGDVTVNNSQNLTFSVSNTGEETLTGSVSGLASPFSCTSGCSYSLSGGASQTTTIRFSPTATGSFNDTAVFESNAGNLDREVTGNGIAEVPPPPPPPAQCEDGIDNDGDGLVDYPSDPGCDSLNDDDETDPPPPPPPPGPTVIFEDSFENGLSGWTQDGQNDWFSSTQRATDGSRSAEIDGRANDAELVSSVIDLGGAPSATITFSWLIERRVDRNEYIAFDTSTDGGATWTEQARLRGNVDQEDVWHDVNITVSGSSLMLRFRGTMNRGNEDANVDNVLVVAP